MIEKISDCKNMPPPHSSPPLPFNSPSSLSQQYKNQIHFLPTSRVCNIHCEKADTNKIANSEQHYFSSHFVRAFIGGKRPCIFKNWSF